MQEARTPMGDPTAIWVVFQPYASSGIRSNTSAKFDHWNGRGQNEGVTSCDSVMSAVRTMNTKGATNITATAMSPAWRGDASREGRGGGADVLGRRPWGQVGRAEDRPGRGGDRGYRNPPPW